MTPQEMIEQLKKTKLTQELLTAAAESVREGNHDETDTELVKAIHRATGAGGMGPKDIILLGYFRATCGVSVKNALETAKKVMEAVEDNKEQAAMLKSVLTDIIKADLHPKHQEILDKFDLDTLSFLWALYQQGIIQGVFLGWRGHEIAMLESSESEPIYTSDNPNVAEVQGKG